MRVVCLETVQRSFHVRAKLLDAVNGTKYEDKDGDWMPVVDVPGSELLQTVLLLPLIHRLLLLQ
jgi:hypothetical protein